MPVKNDAQTTEILVSGFGHYDTGGGVFALRDGQLRQIDRVASGSIAVSPDAKRLVRALANPAPHADGEILFYDEFGVEFYRRSPALAGIHDALWHGDELVTAATSTNSLCWLDAGGSVTRTWVAPGVGDAWHLNCLAVANNRLYASAFGRGATDRSWNAPDAARNSGFVFDVASGQTVIDGLTAPHHPRYIDGRWIVCDSGRGDLAAFDDSGRERVRVALGGWTRGLAHDDDHVYVGVSQQRGSHRLPAPGNGALCILDRRTLRLLERLALPCREIYGVALVPIALLGGIEHGFRANNPHRAGEDDQYLLFRSAGIEPPKLWAVADPLRPEDCNIAIELEVDTSVHAGSTVQASYRVENRGTASLVSAPPYPVHVSWRWFKADGSTLLSDGLRASLPRTLTPGASVEGRLQIHVPEAPGTYVFRLTLVQEHVRWFDDLDPSFAAERRIEAAPRDDASETPPPPPEPHTHRRPRRPAARLRRQRREA